MLVPVQVRPSAPINKNGVFAVCLKTQRMQGIRRGLLTLGLSAHYNASPLKVSG